MEEQNYTTSEAAKEIGVSHQTLRDWVNASKIPAPELVNVGKNPVRLWSKTDIENARKFKGTSKRGPKSKATKDQVESSALHPKLAEVMREEWISVTMPKQLAEKLEAILEKWGAVDFVHRDPVGRRWYLKRPLPSSSATKRP